MLGNEKYKGDLLQGKTFTVDPITKRRLGNLGEVDQYLMKDHHEPIISEEMWEQAQAILKRRTVVHENSNVDPNSYREQYSRKFAFSCMVKCGFCGASLTRRSWHSGSKYHKNIWLCISSSKYGKKNCPESKGIAEEVLESAFVESYRMITNDHKDVLEEFLQRTEEELHSDATLQEIDRVKKELKQLEQKMQRLLDMHLEQQIDFGTYEDKKLEIIKEQQLKTTELKRLQGEADVEKDLRKRLDAMRKLLSEAPILKEFDRNVFESIVEKVIVGGYDDEGNADPSMITFVYKTGFEDKKKGDDYKPPRRNSKSKKLSSQPTDDSGKLSQQATDVARRDYSVATKVELVEILYFKHFYEHFTFGETDWSKRGKRLEKYVRVSIVIELVTVGTKLED
ncbi:MAG: recombinase zinc beta ribbon domain-containing protein [Eubacterium sp.]|nr:recombinase zinc beta ribbon domain-containing protein [Eubacterium sp.]